MVSNKKMQKTIIIKYFCILLQFLYVALSCLSFTDSDINLFNGKSFTTFGTHHPNYFIIWGLVAFSVANCSLFYIYNKLKIKSLPLKLFTLIETSSILFGVVIYGKPGSLKSIFHRTFCSIFGVVSGIIIIGILIKQNRAFLTLFMIIVSPSALVCWLFNMPGFAEVLITLALTFELFCLSVLPKKILEENNPMTMTEKTIYK